MLHQVCLNSVDLLVDSKNFFAVFVRFLVGWFGLDMKSLKVKPSGFDELQLQ